MFVKLSPLCVLCEYCSTSASLGCRFNCIIESPSALAPIATACKAVPASTLAAAAPASAARARACSGCALRFCCFCSAETSEPARALTQTGLEDMRTAMGAGGVRDLNPTHSLNLRAIWHALNVCALALPFSDAEDFLLEVVQLGGNLVAVGDFLLEVLDLRLGRVAPRLDRRAHLFGRLAHALFRLRLHRLLDALRVAPCRLA
mmetsp:Transcript_17585/g.57466  ORF Transcript_17585/g.57466 Transcript_17585/m.57466 type:complete len:204 (+) Transcript_17585:492-1103(+)